jgi:hypothetical protein
LSDLARPITPAEGRYLKATALSSRQYGHNMSSDTTTNRCEQIIASLGLIELGYEVEITSSEGQAVIRLDHVLRGGDLPAIFIADPSTPEWAERLESTISRWSDIRVVRMAPDIRPESLELVTLLRRQEMVERMANAKSPEATAAVVAAFARLTRAFRGRIGALSAAEADWLEKAFEIDGER